MGRAEYMFFPVRANLSVSGTRRILDFFFNCRGFFFLPVQKAMVQVETEALELTILSDFLIHFPYVSFFPPLSLNHFMYVATLSVRVQCNLTCLNKTVLS